GRLAPVIAYTGQNQSLVRFAISTLFRKLLTFLAKYFDSFFEISVGFLKGFFAIHHAGPGLITQFFYIFGRNTHNEWYCLIFWLLIKYYSSSPEAVDSPEAVGSPEGADPSEGAADFLLRRE